MLVTDSHFLVCHPDGLTTVQDELWGVKLGKAVKQNTIFLSVISGLSEESVQIREIQSLLLYYEIFNILSINSDTDLTQPYAYCFTVAEE